MLAIGLRNQLSLETLEDYALSEASGVRLDETSRLREWTEANHRFLLDKIESGWPVYGAVTGFGASSASRIDPSQTSRLQTNLYRYHGCGVGPSFPAEALAAILLVRLNCLVQGASGVSYDLLERLAFMLDNRILPIIPLRGSVGASGDLTPLSYIAAALAGEREVYWRGEIRDAAEVWRALGREPYAFKAREALAIMNGTSVMSALASLAWTRLDRLYQRLTLASAVLVEIWQGAATPFFAELHSVKPHAGQIRAAADILALLKDPGNRLLKTDPASGNATRIGSVQDPYSIRCSPQILGAFRDALDVSRLWIETEINSVNDNPVLRHEDELVLNGGHFLGQHITMAADLLKASLANAINLADRQMALLMEARNRLPENLVAPDIDAQANHGFKAMQITMSSLASELAKMAMPLSAFSRPTEASNQDVVSLGTTAARELYELCGLAEDAVSIHLMALVQALRLREGHIQLNPKLDTELAGIREAFPPLGEDRAMDGDIVAVRRTLFRGSH